MKFADMGIHEDHEVVAGYAICQMGDVITYIDGCSQESAHTVARRMGSIVWVRPVVRRAGRRVIGC